ncbi:TetR/AcrR family transcriptional regulator [Paenibacillus sp. MMS18-CY102]|uniref:TetR/AcrR family transcriptional regulator n=1 Tax=Paenibacillus sp. MMS18-CY102 TaxID=2682849 RepID=UPI0013653CFD|nr:TetR/AcrR family transcriptional regulator [Paenibacillus sp. MMS18-CY102]MWC29381.1 TetR family transcriptional regulator [Paenibacillus sp. MMS18-CY102]
MAEKMDRRQQRTKQLLYDALMSLIEEKGLEHVTVTDISNRAQVNRGTFYLHYQDVPDMIQQLKDAIFNRIRSYVVQMDAQQVMQHANKNEPHPLIVKMFEELAKHADFHRIMLGSNGDLSYAIQLRTMIRTHMYEKFSFLPREGNSVPLDYMLAYVSSANLGMIMHWVESGMALTPYQMGLMMTNIINFGPLIAFGLREFPVRGLPDNEQAGQP